MRWLANILKAATAYIIIAGRAGRCPALWALAVVGVSAAVAGPGLLACWVTGDWVAGVGVGGAWLAGWVIVSDA